MDDETKRALSKALKTPESLLSIARRLDLTLYTVYAVYVESRSTDVPKRKAGRPAGSGITEESRHIDREISLMVADGLCAAEMGRRLGVSRQAVSQRVHKLGLQGQVVDGRRQTVTA